jgi:LPXTG-motif cell wall-anchored protein
MLRASTYVVVGLCVVGTAGGAQAQQYGPARPQLGLPFSPSRAPSCNFGGNPLGNCGFESGSFAGWATTDLSLPFQPLSVQPGGLNVGFGFFTSAPTEGSFAAITGFDGNGPGTIEVGQDVAIPVGTTATLAFDYRAAWDLLNFGQATQNRTFQVQVEPAGGGAPLQTTPVLTAAAGTVVVDTGDVTNTVVNLSPFAGQTVRVNFVWNVPETNTGPAFFQLDNVSITLAAAVPTMQSWQLPVLGLLLIGAGVWVLRRRRFGSA